MPGTFTGDQVGTAAGPIDPLLEALAANGGETMTHALTAASPAVDTGDPATPGSSGTDCEAVDQRDVARPADGDPVPGAVCDIGAYEAEAASADLAVTKTDDADPVDINATITYTITVTYNGPDEAAGVTLVDDLPAAAVFVAAVATAGSCSYAAGPHQVSYSLGTMADGAQATVTVEATAPAAPGLLVNTAGAGAVTPDPSTGDNSASESTTVSVLNGPDLELVTVDDTDPVLVGDHITYTIFVSNNGNLDATGLTLNDDLTACAATTT